MHSWVGGLSSHEQKVRIIIVFNLGFGGDFSHFLLLSGRNICIMMWLRTSHPSLYRTEESQGVASGIAKALPKQFLFLKLHCCIYFL